MSKIYDRPPIYGIPENFVIQEETTLYLPLPEVQRYWTVLLTLAVQPTVREMRIQNRFISQTLPGCQNASPFYSF
jgi:hypothetical protein